MIFDFGLIFATPRNPKSNQPLTRTRMFNLHETSRIVLCRAAFLALCLAPTCGVAAWCLAVNLPAFRHAHERAIGQRLGWDARLDEAAAPRPGLTLYQGLELTDPQTGERLAQAPFVEIGVAGDCTSIRLPHPATMNGSRLDVLLRLAERLMHTADRLRPVEFGAQTLTLDLDGGDQTLVDVAGRLRHDPSESRLDLQFRLATADAAAATVSRGETAKLSIVRRHGSAHTTFQLATGGTPLPWRLIASSWRAANRLGQAGTFEGRATASEQSGHWKLDLVGRIDGVDLAQLAASLPHVLTGPAEVELQHVVISDGRVERAAGKLVAGPGTISRSLIHSASDNLALEASRQAALGRDNRLVYKQLNLAFELDDTGLLVRGAVPNSKGAVLADEKQILVRQTSDARQPVVNLLRALVPQTAVQVPATRETSGLAAFLPVPSLVPPRGSEAPLPQAKAIRVVPR
jgi:hypothetical protein